MTESIKGKNKKPAQENLYRDGNTFASSSAPWVGAEAAWRRGIVPPPHEDWKQYKTRVNTSGGHRNDNLALNDEEMATVLSTLPPPSTTESPRPRILSRLSKFAAAAALTAVTAWAISGVLSRNTDTTTTASVMHPAVSVVEPAFSNSLTEATQTEEIATPALPSEPDAVFEDNDEALETAEQLEESPPSAVRRRAASRKRAPAHTARAEKADNPAPKKLAVSDIASSVETEDLPSASNRAEEPVEEEAAAQEPDDVFNVPNPYSPKEQVQDESQPKTKEAPSISRETVRSVMSGIERQVLKCSNGQRGKIVIELTVSGATGRVTNAVTRTEAFANKPTGICAERAMYLAKFPKFDRENITIKYPFEF